jgi:hypothetical protein
MPVILNQIAVGAGLVNNNLVAGSAFEFARVQSIVSIGIAASATGAFCTIQGGSDIIAEEFPIPIIASPVTTSQAYPVVPDNMYFTDVLNPGDRIVIRVRNPTAGSLTFSFIVQLSPTGA